MKRWEEGRMESMKKKDGVWTLECVEVGNAKWGMASSQISD